MARRSCKAGKRNAIDVLHRYERSGRLLLSRDLERTSSVLPGRAAQACRQRSDGGGIVFRSCEKSADGELSSSDGNRILSKYLSHLDGGLFTIIHLESQHWRIARGWLGLFNTSLRTLDALHLAIASAGDFALVTSAQSLLSAADILGVPARKIENRFPLLFFPWFLKHCFWEEGGFGRGGGGV